MNLPTESFISTAGHLKGLSLIGAWIGYQVLKLASKLTSVGAWLFGPLACLIKWSTLLVLPEILTSKLVNVGRLCLEPARFRLLVTFGFNVPKGI